MHMKVIQSHFAYDALEFTISVPNWFWFIDLNFNVISYLVFAIQFFTLYYNNLFFNQFQKRTISFSSLPQYR